MAARMGMLHTATRAAEVAEAGEHSETGKLAPPRRREPTRHAGARRKE